MVQGGMDFYTPHMVCHKSCNMVLLDLTQLTLWTAGAYSIWSVANHTPASIQFLGCEILHDFFFLISLYILQDKVWTLTFQLQTARAKAIRAIVIFTSFLIVKIRKVRQSTITFVYWVTASGTFANLTKGSVTSNENTTLLSAKFTRLL